MSIKIITIMMKGKNVAVGALTLLLTVSQAGRQQSARKVVRCHRKLPHLPGLKKLIVSQIGKPTGDAKILAGWQSTLDKNH